MIEAASHYETKKSLKASVGKALKYRETSIINHEFKLNGTVNMVGPTRHDRKWYATITLENGIIVKVV